MARKAYGEPTSTEWEGQILDLAATFGWRTAHFRPARVGEGENQRWATAVGGDGKGFPDVLALHPASGDMLVAECKTGRAVLTPEQEQWLASFRRCEIDAFVWYPKHFREAEMRFRTHPARRV